MKAGRSDLVKRYRAALRDCRRKAGEEILHRAYDLGRKAMEDGWGVLDLLAAHQEAIKPLLKGAASPGETLEWVTLGGQFLRETLSSYEMILNGFQDAIDALKQRTAQLEKANARLENEIHERKRAEEALQYANQALHTEILERKKVEKEVLEISLREQRRFGEELHDGVCQSLVGILMMVRSLAEKFRRGNLNDLEIRKVADLLSQLLEQARDMAHGFYPVEMEANSLMVSLEELVGRMAKSSEASCKFHCPEPILIQNNYVATHLYRIAQEAMNNAIRHGAADRIDVSLLKAGGHLILSVTDNGRGLPPQGGDLGSGIGLKIMKYRARMIDGEIEWKANSPQGVQLSCRLPLRAASPETTRRSDLVASSLPSVPLPPG